MSAVCNLAHNSPQPNEHVPLDEPLHTPLTLERQQGQTEREVPPLTRVFGQPESLA